MSQSLKRIGVAIVALMGALGCAHPRLSQPPAAPAEVRAHIGTVGVASARFAPETEFWKPNTATHSNTEATRAYSRHGARTMPNRCAQN